MKSVKKLIDRIAAEEPQNESQLMRMTEVGLRYLGEGSFRVAFEIIDYPLIVKVPLTSCYSDMHHANEEWNWIEKVDRYPQYRALRKYMPKVYYFDEDCGLMIMRKYQRVKVSLGTAALDRLVLQTTGATGHDIGSNNMGKDDKGNLKILDVALLGRMADEDE